MTVRRRARNLGLCGVAAIGVFTLVACDPTAQGGAPPPAPTLLSLEIPNSASGGLFTGVTPAITATAAVPANYFVLPLPTTAPTVRVILKRTPNSVVAVTATDVRRGLTATLPSTGPSGPAPTTGYFYLHSVTSNSSLFYIRYPNSFQGSKAIRTMITETVGGVESAPLTFDMSFRGSTLTVSVTSENPDGRVTSNPPGIDCPSVCTIDFLNGTSVILTQSVTHNATEFIGWTGACTGTGNTCNVPLLAPGPAVIPANPAVTAHFKIHVPGGSTPATPASGVEEITLFRSTDPGDDQFDYVNPLLLFLPKGALVTSVTNVSRDRNGNGVQLELVQHTDGTSNVTRSLPKANCPTAPLEPQASTTIFNGLKVEGQWKVRAVCLSNTFLIDPPARIALAIAWTQ